jgi:hypothetical protein
MSQAARSSVAPPRCAPVRSSSDAALMQRMQSGSAAAFGELYHRHVARALRVAQAVCVAAALA